MTTKKRRRWIIFPLEIVERELSGKLLVCDEALERGWGCIIGTKRAIKDSLDYLPSGTVLLKSIVASELSYMQKFRNKSHKLACLDEEGLVQNSIEHMVSVRATNETIKKVDAFMLWGKVQEKAFSEKYPKHKNKFHVVGNPRADLWGKEKYYSVYEKNVNDIKNKYGDYFIIPTSFGAYNHFMGKEGAVSIYKVDKMVPDSYFSFLKGYRDYVKNIYYGFAELIEPLSQNFPEMNIIIRPHPSENRKPWDRIAEKYNNVHVVFSGGITPWLLGAKAVIHCGSTTAVEAHLLKKTVISYCRDYNDPEYSLIVPAKASINVTDKKEVITILQDVINGKDVNTAYPEVAEGHEWLKNWIDNIDAYESSHRIMDVIENLDITEDICDMKAIPEKKKSAKEILKSFIWYCLSPLEYSDIAMKLLPFRIKQGIRSRRYGKSKTKDINAKELETLIDNIRNTNNRQEINITKLKKNLFVLCSKP